MTNSDLRRLWESIQSRRSGLWGSLSALEQCAALLFGTGMTPSQALAYARGLVVDAGHGYWFEVVRHLEKIAD